MPIKAHYPPDMFKMIPMSELAKQHFDFHPIWSEFYDYDEREEIIAWGVDPQWLDRKLDSRDAGNDHWAYPVLRPYPLPIRMRIYIRALFRSPTDVRFEGSIVNDDAYCISLFVANEEFVFSSHPMLHGGFDLESDRLCNAIRSPNAQIFPLRYTTEFLDRNDRIIQGFFERSAPQ